MIKNSNRKKITMSFTEYVDQKLSEIDASKIDWDRYELLDKIDQYDSDWTIIGEDRIKEKFYIAIGTYTGDELAEVTDIEEISEEEYLTKSNPHMNIKNILKRK